MEKLTYKQAYDKIIQAYFKDEIKPYHNKFCFCGTLAPNEEWRSETVYCQYSQKPIKNPVWYPYTIPEYLEMEKALLNGIRIFLGFEGSYFAPFYKDSEEEVDIDTHILENNRYEDALFEGMCAALEVLKEIHKSRGENVEDFQFEKREIKIISD